MTLKGVESQIGLKWVSNESQMSLKWVSRNWSKIEIDMKFISVLNETNSEKKRKKVKKQKKIEETEKRQWY